MSILKLQSKHEDRMILGYS